MTATYCGHIQNGERRFCKIHIETVNAGKKRVKGLSRHFQAQRFGLFLGIFLILTGLTFWDNGLSDIYNEYRETRVCFYIPRSEQLDLTGFAADTAITKNGTGVIVETAGENADKLRRGFENIYGESVTFPGNTADAECVIKMYRAKTVCTERIPLSSADGSPGGEITVTYAYSRLLTKSVTLGGKKVNLQAAVNTATGKVTIGTPLILGSY